MEKPSLAGAAAVLVLAVVVLAVITAGVRAKRPGPSDRFWTQYGGGVPPDEQARRADAAEKGVPDMAWAEAYWPPTICELVGPRPAII